MSQSPDLRARFRRPDPRLIRVGSFALVALALCAGVILVLGGSRWFHRSAILETYFDESVQGLDVGSKIKYRGVVLGRVTHIGFTYDRYERDNTSGNPKRYVLVEAAVRPELVGIHTNWDEQTRQKEIDKGLRVRLAAQGLTGTSYLEMDYVDPATNVPLPITWVPDHFYIPSAHSTVTQIVDAAEQTLSKVEHLDLETTVANLNRLLASLDRAVNAVDTRGLSNRADATLQRIESIPFGEIGGEARSLLAELRETNRALRQTIANPAWMGVAKDLQAAAAQVRRVAEDPALPSLVRHTDQIARRVDHLLASREGQLADVVDNLQQLSENLRQLSEVLKRQPSAVLFAAPEPALHR